VVDRQPHIAVLACLQGGPGVTQSDILIINKTDLAEIVRCRSLWHWLLYIHPSPLLLQNHATYISLYHGCGCAPRSERTWM
jgi:hypothetical protein